MNKVFCLDCKYRYTEDIYDKCVSNPDIRTNHIGEYEFYRECQFKNKDINCPEYERGNIVTKLINIWRYGVC